MLKKSLVYATLTFAFCTFFDSHIVNGMDDGEEVAFEDPEVTDSSEAAPGTKKGSKSESSVSSSDTTDIPSEDGSSFSSDLNKPDWDGLKGKLSKKTKKFSKLPDSSNDKAVKAFKKEIGRDTNFFLYVLKTYGPEVNKKTLLVNEATTSSLYQLFSGDKKPRKNFLSALIKSFKYTNGKWAQPNIAINGKSIKLFDPEELAKVKEKQLSKFLTKQVKGMLKDLKTFYMNALKINQLDKLVSTLNSLDGDSLSGVISSLETFATKDSGSKVVDKKPVVPTTPSVGITSQDAVGAIGGMPVAVSGSSIAAPTPKKYGPRSRVQTPRVDPSAPIISAVQPTVINIPTADPILGLPINKRNKSLVTQALSEVDKSSAVRIYQLLKNWNIIIPQGAKGVNPKYTMTSYDQAYLVGALTRLAGKLDEAALESNLNTLISNSPKEVYIFNNRQRIIERFTATLVRELKKLQVPGAVADSGVMSMLPYMTEVPLHQGVGAPPVYEAY